jgi:iron complex outermembrane receptor protein
VKTPTSMVAIAWASAAFAQNSSPVAPAPQEPTPAAHGETVVPMPTRPDTSDVNEIIVTAQRRSERLVDVPISVATASPADLERAGPTSLENLTKVTPGVYFQRAAYGLSPTVRGIGSTLPASAGEQNVALYVDEIYYPTPTGNVFDLASVAGVEVLKGPQGTLFGRNATGGAILIRTLDPDFVSAGRFNLSYERFNQVRASAYVNVPVNDKVAVNASVAYRYSEGYVHDLRSGDITDQGKSFTARGKLLLKPTDSFSVIFVAAHADFSDPTGTIVENLQPAPLITVASGGPIATDRLHSSTATDQFLKTSSDEYSARAKLDTGAGTVSSFTAFLRNKLDARSDLTGSYLDIPSLPKYVALKVDTKTFSQEVNLTSDADRQLTYVAGVYYFRNRGSVPFLLQANGIPTEMPLFNTSSQNDAIAGYANATYKLGALSLIGGIRYSYERRKQQSAFGVSAPSPFTRFQKATDKNWTPRLGLQYAIAQRTNVYATYSKGFKSGSFDASSPTGPGVVPETVDAFEVGLKHASRIFSFNVASFFYDYKNTQVNSTVSGGNGEIVTQLFNVPKSRIYGAEADATLRLSSAFDLHGAVAYTHARYIDFPNAPGYVNDPANPATLGGLLFANVSVDASGKHMVRSPDFTASSSLTYHAQLGDQKEFEATLSPYYSSRVYFTFDNSLSQKAYVTLDGSIALTLNKSLKVSVFGRNLTNSGYAIAKAQSVLSLDSVAFSVPRTYGVSLGYTF